MKIAEVNVYWGTAQMGDLWRLSRTMASPAGEKRLSKEKPIPCLPAWKK